MAEYIFRTYDMVLAPMNTQLILRMASDFIRSAENREGSETPRYSKTNLARFCSGWIQLPAHECIIATPVMPASLYFLIILSNSEIWLSSMQGLDHSRVILSAPTVLSGREGA
jgi:hypothetical protein